MIEAVIFDFDGVITDSEVLHFRAFNEVLGPHGISLTKQEYYRDCLGLSDHDLFVKMADEGLLRGDEEFRSHLITQKNRVFEQLARHNGMILDGVEDFLERLRQSEIPMAICSGALLSEIELILDKAGLRAYFETIVSADQVKKGKPHPEGYLLALRRLREITGRQIPNEKCVVIEDSRWGLNAAQQADMHPVAITNSYPADQLAPAEMVIDSLAELSIDKLNQLC